MGNTLQDLETNPDLNLSGEDAERLIAEMENPPEPEPKPDPKPKGAERDDEPKPVVKTRDGKHEIPFSVLEAERRRARELQAELDAMRQQQPSTPAPPADTGADTTDPLQALIDEYGADHELVLAFRQERARNEATTRDLAELKAWRQQQQNESVTRESLTVEEAIDSVFAGTRGNQASILRQWQQEQNPLWDAAVALDQRLQNDPEHQHLPMRDRFEKVIEILGHKPKPKPRDHAQTVEDKLAARDTQPLPRSLSDIPGGDFADQTEREQLEHMTGAQLDAKLARMTTSEQDAWLARL